MKPIPLDLLDKYVRREITSAELAAAVGCHPVTIRRNIVREKRVKKATNNKTALFQARESYRASVADKPIEELMKILHVARSTAYRIKEKYA